jgi:predicted nuclease of predicted toxin-antitoxin system
LEKYSGVSDIEVIAIANENKCLLITEDKDFGELTYRLNIEHKGILLIRLSDLLRIQRLELASATIIKYLQEMKGNFSVLNANGLRIKTSNK